MKPLYLQKQADRHAADLHEALSEELCLLLSTDRPFHDAPPENNLSHGERMRRALLSYSLGIRAHAVRRLLELRRKNGH